MDREKKLLILSGIIWFVANLHTRVMPSHFFGLGLADHIYFFSYGIMIFFMFIMSPLWMNLGEQGYRIEILNMATVLYGVIQASLGFISSAYGVLFLRGLGGAVASGFQVGLISLVMDMENSKDLAGRYVVVMSLSKVLSYLVGGILGFMEAKYILYGQGFLMLLVSVFIKLILGRQGEDERTNYVGRPKYLWDLVAEARSLENFFSPWVRVFLVMTFFISLSYSGINNTINYYLREALGLRPLVNGVWLASIGILGLLINRTFNIWLVKNKDTRLSLILLLGASSFLALLGYFSQGLVFLGAIYLYSLVYTMESPILEGFAVRSDLRNISIMTGIFNGVKYLGEMSGALAAGLAYGLTKKLAFFIGGLAIGLALVLGIVNYIREDFKSEV